MFDALAFQLSQDDGGSTGLVQRGLDILEGPYPKTFDDFIGQNLARRMILTAVEAAMATDAPALDHVLIASGIPGCGKTTLARLTAAVLDVGFVELGGVVTDKDAIKALRQMTDGDVLFLDEIHRLVQGGRGKAEWLLTLMQDGKIQTGVGAFRAPAITIIGATTDAQKLPQTILDRFRILPVLTEYSTPEAVRIGHQTARRLGFGTHELPMPDADGWLRDVAKACDNNPRRIGQLIASVKDVAVATSLSNRDDANGYDISLSLEYNGLTSDGLTKGAQDYLLALFLNDGSAGATTVKALVREGNVDHTEQYLLSKGYINVGTKGRSLTDFGLKRAHKLARERMATHVAREEIA